MTSRTELKEIISSWSKEDLQNLATITKVKNDAADVDSILDAIRWHFHSKARHSIGETTGEIFRKISGKMEKPKDLPPIPSYDDLLNGVATQLKIKKYCFTTNDYETYIPQAIIIAALDGMTPEQRNRYFTEKVDPSGLAHAAGIESNSLGGVTTTAGVLVAVLNCS